MIAIEKNIITTIIFFIKFSFIFESYLYKQNSIQNIFSMSVVVRNLTKVYGKQKAVDSISFEIKEGEIAGFIGPNGAGKSTTMKILTGYIPPTSGEAFINDISIYDDTIEIRKNIGYLPEQNPLYPDMYVREFLEYTASIYKVADKQKEIKKVIEMTGLGIEQHKRIGQLSKGYKQRVGLAQAMIHNPQIMILDEPTTGLDPNQIIEIRNLISEIGKEKTVMLSTHIMQEVEAICDRIIIIDKGKIVANDSREKISQTNKKEELFVFIVEFEENVSEEILNEIESAKKVVKAEANKFIIQSYKDIRKDIFNFAVSKNLTVLSLSRKEKTLEEIFHELTAKK